MRDVGLFVRRVGNWPTVSIDDDFLGCLYCPSIGRRFGPPTPHDARSIVKGCLCPDNDAFSGTHNRSHHVAAHRSNPGTNRASNRWPRVSLVGDAHVIRSSATYREQANRQGSRPNEQDGVQISGAVSFLIFEMMRPFHEREPSVLAPAALCPYRPTLFTNRITPHWAVFTQELITAQ